jgi:predicted PurR-regulated permease PerM
VLVVMIAFGAFGALGYVVGKQILELARNIDTYKGNIIAKVERVRPGRSDVMNKLANAAADVQDKLEGPATTQASKAATQPTELVAQEISKRTDTPRTVTEATKGEAPNPATQPTREVR